MLQLKKKNIIKNMVSFVAVFAVLQCSCANALYQDEYTNVDLKKPIQARAEFSITDLKTQPRGKEDQIKLNGSGRVTDKNVKISISLRDSDVQQVLRMLADKAKLNIIFHSSVQGKVTLDLVNSTVNDAFTYVFEACQLSYFKDGNTLIVVSNSDEAAKSLAKQVLTTIPVKYVSADSVADFLNDNIYDSKLTGTSGDKIATSNPRTNEVMIFGTKADADFARKIVAKLDTKPMINRFRLSHTTPSQMAKLICDTLFTSESTNVETATSQESDILTLGGGKVACKTSNGQTDGTTKAFKGQVASIVYLEQLGEVAMYGGSYEQAQLVRDFIASHDIKQPMAYVEINIIELNEEGSNNFNTAWRLGTPFGAFQFDTSNGVTVDYGTIVDTAGHFFPTSYQGKELIMSTLQWLIKDGKGRTLSNPKVIVTNGQKTTIDLTSDYVKSVDVDISYSGVSSTPLVERTYNVGNDNGIKIELTPFISPDGYVSLNLKPDYSSIKEKVMMRTAQTNPEDPSELTSVEEIGATLLQKRNLDLKNLRIKDGETLILAGFIQEVETQNNTKIPFFGDLPLIGFLFRGTSSTKEKAELVITVTPHIIYSEEEIAKFSKVKL